MRLDFKKYLNFNNRIILINKFNCQHCFILCLFSTLLFSQKVDIYNNISIIGRTSVSGEKVIYKYIRNNNRFIAFRLKKDSVSKMYNYNSEVISIKKDFETIKIINPKDKKLQADFERLEEIKEKYTYYHKDSIILSNREKRKYQRLFDRINSTAENNLKIKLKNELVVTLDGTVYTFNLSIMNEKKSIGIYSLTKKEYPLLYDLLKFSRKRFSEKIIERRIQKIHIPRKISLSN
jgi:hypothetical protein